MYTLVRETYWNASFARFDLIKPQSNSANTGGEGKEIDGVRAGWGYRKLPSWIVCLTRKRTRVK